MADSMLKDRQDIPIWNAIEAGNLKQALKLVDKRLAKKHTDYLEALKIYIRSHSLLVSEKAAVVIHLEELLERKPVLVDPEAISLYDEALEGVLPQLRESWEKTIGELRWQGVKAMPKNEELSLKCFQACLSKDDLEHARQISNSLEKNFPSNHAYIFWNITTLFLFSQSQNYPEKQRMVWGRLALGQIDRLAVATINAGDSKPPPIRSIHTPQELLLLHKIAEAHGDPKQRLKYLQNPYLGPESTIAKGEWELWRYKLKLMEIDQKWQDLFDMTSNLLKRARTKNESGQLTEAGMGDWRVWQAYISSAKALQLQQCANRISAEVAAHLDPASGIDKTWRRNASLAWLEVVFGNMSPHFNAEMGKDSLSQENGHHLGRISAIVKYLQLYGDASTAYNDLRRFAENLTAEEREQLSSILMNNTVFGSKDKPEDIETRIDRLSFYPLEQSLETASKITELVNTYKLTYLLTSSLPEYERQHSSAYKTGQETFVCRRCSKPCGLYCACCLEILAEDTFKSYGSAINDDGHITKILLPTDRHPADDFSILSAMCLIKLSVADINNCNEDLTSPRIFRLLQAAVVLEYALSRSKPNFQLSLILIRLYCLLGCGSLAMRAHQRLGLKKIQLDTLAYTLFDRISTLHPHPFSHTPHNASKYSSPHQNFNEQQKLYRGARDQVSQNCWMAFEHGSYNSILEITEFSETLSRTMAAAMSVIESRKISRLTEPATPLTNTSGGYDVLPPNPELLDSFSDTNDYDSFPNFEASQTPRFETLSQSSPGPSNYRYHMHLLVEKLMLIVDPSHDSHGEGTADALWLKNYFHPMFEKVQKQLESRVPGAQNMKMTWSENSALLAYDDMAHIIQDACDRERRPEPGFQGILDKFNMDLCTRLEEQLALIDSIHDSVPASASTLHSIYTAYELGRIVLNFHMYLSHPRRTVPKSQIEANENAVATARKLLQRVVGKSAMVKKTMDESGWIDKVLDSILRHGQDVTSESTSLPSFAKVLKSVVDENFLEEWAGHVVESWRDSVVGFSYLKAS